MNKPAIKIDKLHKIYDDGFNALKGIDLTIPQGSFFGLLGPNGAGKTTTIGILTGLVNLTSGSASILGNDIVKEYKISRKNIGLSPQELNFDVFFSIEKMLILQAGYYGIPKNIAKERVNSLLKQFGLIHKAKNTARELSGGMKRRFQIAKALVHDPPIIILDEPTAGVDIELRHMLWEFLKKINSNGKTILLTTHYIEEAESLCNDVAIIDQGKIITKGSPKKLINNLGKSILEIKIQNKNKVVNLKRWTHSINKNLLQISTKEPEADMPKIINLLNEQNITIEEIKICKSSLEDVFLNLTGKSILSTDNKSNYV